MLGVLAAGIAGQGRIGEAATLLDEARSSNPEYRDSILLELEAVVRWIAGDFPISERVAADAAGMGRHRDTAAGIRTGVRRDVGTRGG